MTTADAKVTKLPPEMQQAWVDFDPGFEPKEPLTISQCTFVRSAFFAGWSAALEASPNSRTEAALLAALVEVVASIRGKGPRDGKVLARADAVIAAMQAARPIDRQEAATKDLHETFRLLDEEEGIAPVQDDG